MPRTTASRAALAALALAFLPNALAAPLPDPTVFLVVHDPQMDDCGAYVAPTLRWSYDTVTAGMTACADNHRRKVEASWSVTFFVVDDQATWTRVHHESDGCTATAKWVVYGPDCGESYSVRKTDGLGVQTVNLQTEEGTFGYGTVSQLTIEIYDHGALRVFWYGYDCYVLADGWNYDECVPSGQGSYPRSG